MQERKGDVGKERKVDVEKVRIAGVGKERKVGVGKERKICVESKVGVEKSVYESKVAMQDRKVDVVIVKQVQESRRGIKQAL